MASKRSRIHSKIWENWCKIAVHVMALLHHCVQMTTGRSCILCLRTDEMQALEPKHLIGSYSSCSFILLIPPTSMTTSYSPYVHYIYYYSTVVQSLSHVQLSVTPWTAARQAPLPSTISEVCSDSCPLSWWCYPTVSFSILLYLLLRIHTTSITLRKLLIRKHCFRFSICKIRITVVPPRRIVVRTK